ncbi:MAG: hypothetical protein IPM91_09770 [Bacteroidetes bacterium]|jgi:hypothetical protein|nr:hypothetical protein [Bacteroidota bacterium]
MKPLKQYSRKHDQSNKYALRLANLKVNRLLPILENSMALIAILIFVYFNIQNIGLL